MDSLISQFEYMKAFDLHNQEYDIQKDHSQNLKLSNTQ
jgi:hypothetical protein